MLCTDPRATPHWMSLSLAHTAGCMPVALFCVFCFRKQLPLLMLSLKG